MPITPIATEYRGIPFRSRMEARWAVFFDTLGMRFEYEWQPYKTSYGLYLPDFYFPDTDSFAELKPVAPNIIQETKIAELAEGTDRTLSVWSSWLMVGDPLSAITPQALGGTRELNNRYVFRTEFNPTQLDNWKVFDASAGRTIWNRTGDFLGAAMEDLLVACAWEAFSKEFNVDPNENVELLSNDYFVLELLTAAAWEARQYQFWKPRHP